MRFELVSGESRFNRSPRDSLISSDENLHPLSQADELDPVQS